MTTRPALGARGTGADILGVMSRPVARSRGAQRLDVMALLRAHVPLTLLVDLVLVDQERPLEPVVRGT